MAATVDTVYAPPDPSRFLPGQPIRASDWRRLARAQNKLNADGGVPPIRQAWSDGQFACSGVRTRRNTFQIPEWSPAHTTAGLLCRVQTEAFGGAAAKVRFTSVNSGNFVEATPGALAGWYDAPDPLVCSFVGGVDDIEVAVATGSGTLTITNINCAWPTLPDPLDAEPNGDFLPLDDGETADDAPLSARLGRTLIRNSEALEERVHVYACYSGLEGIVSGGIDCSAMPATFHWLWCLVLPGTVANDWRLSWHMTQSAPGVLGLVFGPADEATADAPNHVEIDGATGDFRLIESTFTGWLAPLELGDLLFVPAYGGAADPLVNSLTIWGR